MMPTREPAEPSATARGDRIEAVPFERLAVEIGQPVHLAEDANFSTLQRAASIIPHNVGAGRLPRFHFTGDLRDHPGHRRTRRKLPLNIQAVFFVHLLDDMPEALTTAQATRRPHGAQDLFLLGAGD